MQPKKKKNTLIGKGSEFQGIYRKKRPEWLIYIGICISLTENKENAN